MTPFDVIINTPHMEAYREPSHGVARVRRGDWGRDEGKRDLGSSAKELLQCNF